MGAKRHSSRSSDDDSDDENSLTIDESRTNRNVNEIVEMAARLFNIPKSDLKTKMLEHSSSSSLPSTSDGHHVTSGLKRSTQQ